MAKDPPIHYMSQDYIPTLNSPVRRPAAKGGGCFKNLMIALLILGAIAGLIWIGISAFFPSKPMLVPTPTENRIVEALILTSTVRPTLDSWSATGTALIFATASPTADYCAWLTPTPTHTPTLPYTPDPWQARGTALYEATNPPRTPIPQPTTPRSWCDFQTPTFTPLALQRDRTAIAFEPTSSPTPSLTPTMIVTIKTIPSGGGGDGGVVIQPTAPPVIIQPTNPPVVLPTNRPTKKPKKTRTPTATYTPTLTQTPTVTPSATDVPTLNVILANCAAGYPTFIVQGFGGLPQTIEWQIVIFDSAGAAATLVSGQWAASDIMPPHAGVIDASLLAGMPGEFWLMVQGQPVVSVTCSPVATVSPTPTATPTVPPEVTLEPVATITPEGQS